MDNINATTPSEKPSATLAAALTYAKDGWSVFPCKPNKKPYTKNGFHDATTDPEQLKKWWASIRTR